MRGLSCYNNPNRLTGKAQTVEGAAACSLWKRLRDQSEGVVQPWGGGASTMCCSLTSGEGKSPTGKSIERQIGADRGGDAIRRSGSAERERELQQEQCPIKRINSPSATTRAQSHSHTESTNTSGYVPKASRQNMMQESPDLREA